MGNKLNQLQHWINVLKTLAQLQALIDEIIAIAGAIGGIIIPPRPTPLKSYEEAQEWHDQMHSNWVEAGSPEPPPE